MFGSRELSETSSVLICTNQAIRVQNHIVLWWPIFAGCCKITCSWMCNFVGYPLTEEKKKHAKNIANRFPVGIYIQGGGCYCESFITRKEEEEE